MRSINTYNPNEPPHEQIGTIDLNRGVAIQVQMDLVPVEFIHLWVLSRLSLAEETGKKPRVVNSYQQIEDLLVELYPDLRSAR